MHKHSITPAVLQCNLNVFSPEDSTWADNWIIEKPVRNLYVTMQRAGLLTCKVSVTDSRTVWFFHCRHYKNNIPLEISLLPFLLFPDPGPSSLLFLLQFFSVFLLQTTAQFFQTFSSSSLLESNHSFSVWWALHILCLVQRSHTPPPPVKENIYTERYFCKITGFFTKKLHFVVNKEVLMS